MCLLVQYTYTCTHIKLMGGECPWDWTSLHYWIINEYCCPSACFHLICTALISTHQFCSTVFIYSLVDCNLQFIFRREDGSPGGSPGGYQSPVGAHDAESLPEPHPGCHIASLASLRCWTLRSWQKQACSQGRGRGGTAQREGTQGQTWIWWGWDISPRFIPSSPSFYSYPITATSVAQSWRRHWSKCAILISIVCVCMWWNF